MSDKELIAECSQIIYDGFIRYNNYFHRITRRARTRFEQRDWKGHQNDIVDRVDLYEKSVRRIVLALRRTLGPQLTDKNLWHDIRGYFANRLNQVPDNDFIKTFFNSTTRRITSLVALSSLLQIDTNRCSCSSSATLAKDNNASICVLAISKLDSSPTVRVLYGPLKKVQC